MRPCLPRLCATSSSTGALYASGSWATLRETVTAPSTDTVKDLLTPSLVPTRHFQRSLSKLPLPGLNETLQRYLVALQPLCTPAQHAAAAQLVKAFKEKTGPRLQDELRRTDKANPHTSFISSDIFETQLRSRQPLPLHAHRTWLLRPDQEKADMLVRSTYWLWASVHMYKLYLDNELEPEVRLAGSAITTTTDGSSIGGSGNSGGAGGSSESMGQYWRQDWFQRSAALLPDLLSTPLVYSLSKGNVVPLDMSQFDCLFNCTRVPGVLQDEVTPVGYVPQVTVQYRGHQFIITVADADCVPLSVDQIYAQLRDIVQTNVAPPHTDVGLFTALPRSEWNAVRTQLLRDAGNSKSMEAVEESMFVLNLDEVDREGGGGGGNGDPLCAVGMLDKVPTLRSTNRWWDKSLSVSVNARGAVAVSAEASWGDGVAVRRYMEVVQALSHAAHSDLLRKDAPTTHPVRQLQWTVPVELHTVAAKARRQMDADRQRLDVAAGVLDVAGLSSTSVEATLQLAAQLAWWRLQQRPTCCVQETRMHRYRRGRIERVSLTTPETSQFLLSTLGKDTAAQRIACRAALQSYTNLRRSVEKGHGISCHLLGLRMTAQRLLGRVPDLFSSPAHALLDHGELYFDMMEASATYGRGFAVNPCGYHLSCSRSGKCVVFQVSNLPSSSCTVPSSTSYAEAFREACRDVSVLQTSST